MANQPMFRDFQVSNDIKKMMELRYFDKEYTMYGSLFFEQGEARYIISSQKDKLIDYLLTRQYFKYTPFPIIKHTLTMAVPSGNEEEIARMVKVKLAKRIRDEYGISFLQAFHQLAVTPNDNQAAPILDALKIRMMGLYRKDNLRAFEGLMDIAYQAKHLTDDVVAGYEAWLADEWAQMEDDVGISDRFCKEMYGFCYLKNEQIHAYCKGVKEKASEKRHEITTQGGLVGQLFTKEYWYNYDQALSDIRKQYETFLLDLFDDTYFDYLLRIKSLPSAIMVADFEAIARKYGSNNCAQADAMEHYRYLWGI